MPTLGVIADDFTGTASAGVMLAQKNIRTGLFYDIDMCREKTSCGYEAIYVSSNTRNADPADAYARVKSMTEILRSMDVRHFGKKIDSTFRGSIGAEIDAMLDVLGQEYLAVMVPALPGSNRIVRNGCLFIDSVPLAKTPAAQDMLSPVRTSYIPELLKEQSQNKIGFLTMETIAGSCDCILARMEALVKDGVRIIMTDAVSDRDVEKIAAASAKLQDKKIVTVDPGPFTAAYAEKYCQKETKEEKVPALSNCKEKDQIVLMLAGTTNPLTKKQMEYLWSLQGNEHVSVDASGLLSSAARAEVIAKAVRDSESIIFGKEKCRSIVIETGLHGALLDLEQESLAGNCRKEEITSRINEGLGEIAEQLLAKLGRGKVAGIFMTGGDTMLAVCRALAVNSIHIRRSLAAQVDMGQMHGKYEGMPVVVKGGFCGTDQVMKQIVDVLLSKGE